MKLEFVGSFFVRIVTLLLSLLLYTSCGGGGFTEVPDSAGGHVGDRSAAVVTLEQTLHELETLPVPDGTDSELFAKLKTSLNRSLQSTSRTHFTATVPQSLAGKVTDLSIVANDDGSATFTFCYCNAGDYNQDGLVYVSDLTVLGQQWAKNTGSADWQIAQLADGNDDGFVAVSDITPIGRNYLAMVKGYVLHVAADTTDVPGGAEIIRIELETGAVPPGGGRLTFTFTIDEPVADFYYAVRPYDDAGLGSTSNIVRYKSPIPIITSVSPTEGRTGATITLAAGIAGGVPENYAWNFGGAGVPNTSPDAAPVLTLGETGTYHASLTVANAFGDNTYNFDFTVNANQPPIASLTSAIMSGPAPLAVNLDASASRDDDGLITCFEWDWDSDGFWDDDSGTQPQVQHTFDSIGIHDAMVRVTDDSGAIDTAMLRITVDETGNWNLLVWIAGDNNLAPAGFEDITEMEQVGSTDHVNVLVGYDIDPALCDPGLGGIDQVHFIKVVQDLDPSSINTAGDPANVSFSRAGYNSADPAKLVEFLDWAEANHSAQRTALILWDHGDGWRVGGAGAAAGAKRRPRGRETSGVLGDDTDGEWDLTANAAIINALSGRQFDILAFDACSMADIESLYEYQGLAPWIIASGVSVPNDGFDYHGALQQWNTLQPDTMAVGCIFVDEYIACYNGQEEAQLALLDTSLIPATVAALSDFAEAVTAKAETEAENISTALISAYEFWGEGTRDAIGFLDTYQELTGDTALAGLANSAITACDNLVVYTVECDMAGNNGLAVFLPTQWWWDNYLINEYDGLAFNQATGWLDMLQATVGPEPLEIYEWIPGDHILVSWLDVQATCDLGITDPNGNMGYNWWPEPTSQSIVFGLDDEELGIEEEYAELLPGAFVGEYIVSVWWWWHDAMSPPPFLTVRLQVFDSNWDLKEDLGTVDLTYGEEREIVILNN